MRPVFLFVFLLVAGMQSSCYTDAYGIMRLGVPYPYLYGWYRAPVGVVCCDGQNCYESCQPEYSLCLGLAQTYRPPIPYYRHPFPHYHGHGCRCGRYY